MLKLNIEHEIFSEETWLEKKKKKHCVLPFLCTIANIYAKPWWDYTFLYAHLFIHEDVDDGIDDRAGLR